ncbi:hypothetical protein [Streptomyces sp. 8P21H-1]|uniref:hypothetical protein n=1 Tax=Streptomyces sp. 8P21H-1 TaxID=2737048 RepID=UPI00156F42FA|nr:hypothetical protein [Streptomyces sp. 8P21H-1]NSL43071.1 hypothetical protein [Streptomyces sp. 8P21H-1]
MHSTEGEPALRPEFVPHRTQGVAVTVPEENRPKTTSTDEVVAARDEEASAEQDNGATGRTLREAMEEAGLHPDDVREEN